MRRSEALAILHAHREKLRQRHVTSLALFGSVARDEARPDSDVDLLVEFDGSPVGLLDYVALRRYLAEILGRRVDLATRKDLKRDCMNASSEKQLTQPGDWEVRVDDMLVAARRIQQYMSGMTVAEFERDQRTADAVLRNLIVIGEAARYVPAAVAARYTDLPLIDIRGMRNFLVHQYDNLDTDIVWDTVQRDIDRLVVTPTTILELEP